MESHTNSDYKGFVKTFRFRWLRIAVCLFILYFIESGEKLP